MKNLHLPQTVLISKKSTHLGESHKVEQPT